MPSHIHLTNENDRQQQIWGQLGRNWEPHALLVGMENGTATV